MPSAAFKKAADESRQLKAKPSNDELLEVSRGVFPYQFTAHLL
jgi:acyl-CoA-binding protein